MSLICACGIHIHLWVYHAYNLSRRAMRSQNDVFLYPLRSSYYDTSEVKLAQRAHQHVGFAPEHRKITDFHGFLHVGVLGNMLDDRNVNWTLL